MKDQAYELCQVLFRSYGARLDHYIGSLRLRLTSLNEEPETYYIFMPSEVGAREHDSVRSLCDQLRIIAYEHCRFVASDSVITLVLALLRAEGRSRC